MVTNLRELISKRRKQLKLSQERLGKLSNTSQSYINKLESRPVGHPNPEYFERVINALDLDLDLAWFVAGQLPEWVTKQPLEQVQRFYKNMLATSRKKDTTGLDLL